MKKQTVEKINAMFLVGGTCIGGGMLAMPVTAGLGGYLPSIIGLVIAWLMMTASSLLLIEVNLWMEEGSHVISMAKRFLGPVGQAVSWIFYLYICYASLVSYSAGGGDLMQTSIEALAGFSLSRLQAITLFTVIFTFIIYLGTKIIGRINTLFFSGMIGAYVFLVIMGLDDVNPNLLQKNNWIASTFALPLLFTSFGHQTMVPSLTPMLKRNAKALRFAVVGGTTIAFIVYFFWLTLTLGIVPFEGENGLFQAFVEGVPATRFVTEHVTGFWMVPLLNFFSFFAIVTSFLGTCLGLFDFLSDGLKIPEKGWGKVALGLLIVAPTVFFAVNFQRAFIVAMETTGGIGDAVLNGLIPISMVWVGRYIKKYDSKLSLPGGKPLLMLLALGFFSVLVWEIVMLSTNVIILFFQL